VSGQVGIRVRPRRVHADGFLSPLEACAVAAEYVRAAGFTLVWTSSCSESCYYNFPGRIGTLRIATHRKGGAEGRDGPTIVSVTFPEGSANQSGVMRVKPAHVENHTANAIGLYLIRAKRNNYGVVREVG
jgi:hypothetical protein